MLCGGGGGNNPKLDTHHSSQDAHIPTLSIIIPCFNESRTITHILEYVKNVAITYHKEIIVVDDYSTDGTIEILKDLELTQYKQENTPPPPILSL
ncbi:glycosyltransferase family 2 protein [Helicobacter muridarum]|uniref:Glycosyltransferase n=1 Tax=Helicobacter muridarum TaxID=216 RepID=A0A377PW53_9HELI|nr:glycosyltransferase [Helicobacter muridarum]STQ86797.1 glycosyltransferase [Helicobacter muridarum]